MQKNNINYCRKIPKFIYYSTTAGLGCFALQGLRWFIDHSYTPLINCGLFNMLLLLGHPMHS